MEMDHITLDGESNEGAGIVLLDVDLPDITRNREVEPQKGRLEAIEDEDWEQKPQEIPMVMAVVGESQTDLTSRYMAARRWLLRGGAIRRLSMSELPGYHFKGVITKVTKSEVTDKWIKFTVTFRANPSCPLRVLTQQPGFIPAFDTPVPEQITAENATCSGTFSEPGFLPEVEYEGIHEAELYIVATGSWTTLSIGGAEGLTINWEADNKTVYIDCEHQKIYYLDAGQIVRLDSVTTGDFPAVKDTFAMMVGGTGLNVTVRLLAIERG